MGDLTLWPGDCLERMADIADGTVDLIAADLPYGTTACKWDVVIPFAPLWEHYRRVLKPRGAVVLTASQPFTTDIISSNRKWFKYTLVWEKNRATNFYNTPYQPAKVHEDIAVFSPAAASYSRRGNMTFNGQRTEGEAWTKRDVGTGRHTYHAAKRPRLRISDGGRCPRSVLRFDCEFDFHPTQKPVALFEYLLKTYSHPGDLVLDNACGSGTTLVAALNTGRRCIGIEKDPAIFATAERRIADHLASTPLLTG